MTSTFFGLQIGASALRAHQRAMETIAHNVANVNTEGYSRQEVILAPSWLSVGDRGGRVVLGAGVDVVGIQRYASVFLAQQTRLESGEKARWEALGDALRQIQTLFQEPNEEGLGALFDRFWAAWRDLATDPTNPTLRAQVRTAAEDLATQFRERQQDLVRLQSELSDRIRGGLAEINDLATRIADVDRQIRQGMASGSPPNDLLDQRDRLLAELGDLARITTTLSAGGGITVTLGGHVLVSEQGVNQIDTTADPPTWADDGSEVQFWGGELLGLFEARDQQVVAYLGRLNELASKLIEGVNAVHRNGYGLNNATGLDFFAGSGAGDIRVADAILNDLNNIAAASAPDAPGDGSGALALAQVANAPLTAEGTSLGSYYNATIALIGWGVQRAEAQTNNQSLLLQHLNERRDAISGVSLDEETIKLISSQRAYQAAARVIAAMDEMLEQLIGLGR